MLNLRQRRSRYGFSLNFTVGLTGATIVAVAIAAGFRLDFEIWLAGSLVLVLILHARLGFAFGRAQAEKEILARLSGRADAKQELPVPRLGPALSKVDDLAKPNLDDRDFRTLERVKEAIVSERIDLYLQPIVSLPQRKARYYEAFSRLRDSNGRTLAPCSYIEAAERANRIGVIDNMILMRCIQALRRRSLNDPRLVFFCNLSPATLFDEEFFGDLTDYLEANSDLASNLVFEFTYPAVHMMHPRVEKHLTAIARKGFAFSVDHIHSLDLDWEGLRRDNFCYAKAPASMLLAASRGGEHAAQRLGKFRKRLAEAGVDLIAEKIEHEKDMPEILSLGLDFGQGNLFGPARPAEHYLGEAEGDGDGEDVNDRESEAGLAIAS